jgi:hypothetical protein
MCLLNNAHKMRCHFMHHVGVAYKSTTYVHMLWTPCVIAVAAVGSDAKARQEKRAAKLALSAASAVEQTEQAARRARAAAQRLRAQQMVAAVGPAGGVWGSTNADAALKLPLRVALVGDVAVDRKSSR